MKVLFLDFDGVLNSADYAGRWVAAGNTGCIGIDPEPVARLNRVIEATGAQVVVSSSWRCFSDHDTPEKLEAILRAAGYEHRIFDVTPQDFRCDWHDGDCSQGHRGGEINQWLVEHPHIRVTKFAIVDDSSDMGPLSDRLVQTTWAKGMQDEHADCLVEMLS